MKKFYAAMLFVMGSLMAQAQSPQFITATLVNGGPTFQRPNVGNPPSGLSIYSPTYHVFSFTAPVSGNYTFEANTPSIDNFGALYQGAFNPLLPLSNILRSDDGSSGNPGDNYFISRALTAGVTYILVSTSFYTGEYGSYQVKIEGPFSTPLPVEMSAFNASLSADGQALLHWSTFTEKNCSHYNIQRSVDGITFSNIGSLKSKSMNGNSDEVLEYIFSDANPGAINHYRIQQMDVDGKSTYSAIIRLENEKAYADVMMYPSPVANDLHFQFYNEKSSRAEIQVYDLQGRLVISENFTTADGMNQQHISLAKLQTGQYFVSLNSNGVVLRREMILKR